MSGFNPNRVSKGVPTAGRFTHATHAEATVSLSGNSTLTTERPTPIAPRGCRCPSSPLTSSHPFARSRMLDSVRAAEQVSPMERALAAYASRTVKNGTWEDHVPVIQDRLPDPSCSPRCAFEEAPTRLANTPSVKAAAAAISVIESRKVADVLTLEILRRPVAS